MGTRRTAREEALKIMYQYEMCREDVENILTRYWSHLPMPAEIRSFAAELVRGTIEHIDEIDSEIQKHSANWSLDRIGAIERSILRIAIYELVFRKDIPPKVSINEALEIEKKFGRRESTSFVNGILDKIKGEREMKDRAK